MHLEADHTWQNVKTMKQFLHVFTGSTSWLEDIGCDMLVSFAVSAFRGMRQILICIARYVKRGLDLSMGPYLFTIATHTHTHTAGRRQATQA